MLAINLSSIVQMLIVVLVLCIDSFVISIAYGSNNIKIPIAKSFIISTIGSSFLAISLCIGNFASELIPMNLASKITFFILFTMGFVKLLQSLFKYLVNRIDKSNKTIDFTISNISFSLNINLQEEKKRTNYTLRTREAMALGVALSMDSLALGFGIALIKVNYIQLVILLFFTSFILINLGCFIGRKIAKSTDSEIGWLNGLVLMGMAVSKILKF